MNRLYELLTIPWKIKRYRTLHKQAIRHIVATFVEYGQDSIINIRLDETTKEAQLPAGLEAMIEQKTDPRTEDELAQLQQDPIIQAYERVGEKISILYYNIKSRLERFF